MEILHTTTKGKLNLDQVAYYLELRSLFCQYHKRILQSLFHTIVLDCSITIRYLPPVLVNTT